MSSPLRPRPDDRPELPPIRRAAAIFLAFWASQSVMAAYAYRVGYPEEVTNAWIALRYGAFDQSTWAAVSLAGYLTSWWVPAPAERRLRAALLVALAGAGVIATRYLLLRAGDMAPMSAQPVWMALLSQGPYHVLLFLTSAAGGLAARAYATSAAAGAWVEAMRRQLDDARLQLLAGQLHPHFLFNTLNSVATLLRRSPHEAAEVLHGLNAMLREGFAASDAQLQPLRDELSLLDLYLGIEQRRFGPRLTIRRRVDDALLDVHVPRFVLQVLVENAVRHGAAARRGAAEVTIDVSRSYGAVELAVGDNGPGLPAGWTLEAAGGVGLRNTAARIHHLYGEGASLEVGVRPGGGTAVRVRLPLAGA
jgi:signal transduction histidine kinase